MTRTIILFLYIFTLLNCKSTRASNSPIPTSDPADREYLSNVFLIYFNSEDIVKSDSKARIVQHAFIKSPTDSFIYTSLHGFLKINYNLDSSIQITKLSRKHNKNILKANNINKFSLNVEEINIYSDLVKLRIPNRLIGKLGNVKTLEFDTITKDTISIRDAVLFYDNPHIGRPVLKDYDVQMSGIRDSKELTFRNSDMGSPYHVAMKLSPSLVFGRIMEKSVPSGASGAPIVKNRKIVGIVSYSIGSSRTVCLLSSKGWIKFKQIDSQILKTLRVGHKFLNINPNALFNSYQITVPLGDVRRKADVLYQSDYEFPYEEWKYIKNNRSFEFISEKKIAQNYWRAYEQYVRTGYTKDIESFYDKYLTRQEFSPLNKNFKSKMPFTAAFMNLHSNLNHILQTPNYEIETSCRDLRKSKITFDSIYLSRLFWQNQYDNKIYSKTNLKKEEEIERILRLYNFIDENCETRSFNPDKKTGHIKTYIKPLVLNSYIFKDTNKSVDSIHIVPIVDLTIEDIINHISYDINKIIRDENLENHLSNLLIRKKELEGVHSLTINLDYLRSNNFLEGKLSLEGYRPGEYTSYHSDRAQEVIINIVNHLIANYSSVISPNGNMLITGFSDGIPYSGKFIYNKEFGPAEELRVVSNDSTVSFAELIGGSPDEKNIALSYLRAKGFEDRFLKSAEFDKFQVITIKSKHVEKIGPEFRGVGFIITFEILRK